MRSSSMTHCLQSSLSKRYAWKLKNSFTKEKAQDHVLFSEQIRNLDFKIYPKEARWSWRVQHCGLQSSRHIPLNSSTAVWTKTTYIFPCWSRSSNHISTKNNFLKVWARRRRWTGSVKHRKNCCKIGPDRDLRTLREFCKTSMSWLQFLNGNRDYLFQLREKFEVQAECYNISKGQLRFQFDPWLHH